MIKLPAKRPVSLTAGLFRLSGHRTVAIVLLIAAVAAALAVQNVFAQEDGAHISSLDCEGDPEVVTITNGGSDVVDLSGWRIESDPVASETFDLSDVGQLAAGVSVNVQSGPSSSGALVWSDDEIFRDGDPDDYARLVDDSDTTVDEVACAEPTPSPSPSPTATPDQVPNGGGPPDPRSGPLNVLVIAGAGVSLGAFALIALSLAPALPLLSARTRQSGQLDPSETAPREVNQTSGGTLLTLAVVALAFLIVLAFGARRRR